jgi:hypothetical protein
MIKDSIPDIQPHVGFFWGIAPVLVLPSPLDTVAQGMERDLIAGAPHCPALFFTVGRVVFDRPDMDPFIEIDSALALVGTTKAFVGRRTIPGTATAPLFD